MVRVQSQDGGLAYKMGIRFFTEQRVALPTRERQAMSNMSGRNAMKWVDPHFWSTYTRCCPAAFGSSAVLTSVLHILHFSPDLVS